MRVSSLPARCVPSAPLLALVCVCGVCVVLGARNAFQLLLAQDDLDGRQRQRAQQSSLGARRQSAAWGAAAVLST